MSVRRTTHATVLGYQSPEEFERKSVPESSANFSGATVTFVVDDENSENQERVSPGVSGEGDSIAVLLSYGLAGRLMLATIPYFSSIAT